MSKKFYIITLSVTIFISAALVYSFVYFKSRTKENIVQEAPEGEKDNKYSLLPIEELSKKSKLSLQTEEETVDINNVYKDPIRRLSKNGVEFVKKENYVMDFYPEDEGFIISIGNPDIFSALKEAESEFLNKLGVTEEQACKLKVSITIPVSVSEKYGGGVYGFSFCPDKKHIK